MSPTDQPTRLIIPHSSIGESYAGVVAMLPLSLVVVIGSKMSLARKSLLVRETRVRIFGISVVEKRSAS